MAMTKLLRTTHGICCVALQETTGHLRGFAVEITGFCIMVCTLFSLFISGKYCLIVLSAARCDTVTDASGVNWHIEFHFNTTICSCSSSEMGGAMDQIG